MLQYSTFRIANEEEHSVDERSAAQIFILHGAQESIDLQIVGDTRIWRQETTVEDRIQLFDNIDRISNIHELNTPI